MFNYVTLNSHRTAAFNYHPNSAMSADTNKENIADGLLAPLEAKSVGTRKSKKSRSLSVGPGSLNVPLKEEDGNRRKV
jgi:kinetochore protein Spc7/SPC105